ncbi:MAG TPA: MBL fold metallo-hydrolase [Bacillota bacterium]|nr:MBL fold metallo-hydrolase [Bacillota bacterium]
MATRSWFELKEIAPGLWSLSEPGHFEEVISYLVLGRDRAALIDTGMGIGDLAAAVNRLTRLPIMVINTHADYHHCGANHHYREIAAHPAEAPRIERGWAREEVADALLPHKIWGPLPAGFDPLKYAVLPSRVTRLLDEGDLVELGGRRLRVLHTPGHAAGGLCLQDENSGTLFTGDTLAPTTISAWGDGSDPEQLLASLERLARDAGQVARVCPGHHLTPLGPDFLAEAAAAVARVRSGATRVEPAREGVIRHRFRRFSLLLPGHIDPPPPPAPEPSPPAHKAGAKKQAPGKGRKRQARQASGR